MNQSVNTFLEFNEDTEVREVSDLCRMLAAHRIFHFDCLPRVFLELFNTKTHLTLVAVEGQNNGFYLVAYIQKFLSRTQVLAPRHFTHVDQAFNTRLYLYECTIVGDNHNLSLYVVSHF